MSAFRRSVPDAIDGARVTTVTDVHTGERIERGDAGAVTTERLALPKSNVIAYGLADGSRVTLRPSGTEPKIKYYFDVCEPVNADEDVASARERARRRIASLERAFVALAGEHATS
jgi:phosphomannomutase